LLKGKTYITAFDFYGYFAGSIMDPLTILLIAIGLAMDAFAVSIVKGITVDRNKRRNGLITASFFGGFQMLMSMIGWLAGLSLKELIISVDHWIAFGLLSLVGLKMIYASTKEEKEKKEESLKLHSLLILAVATSIDALMVGLSFAFLQSSVLGPIIVIGIVTFFLSTIGFFFGSRLGHVFGNKVKSAGGLILIVIGLRILLEHLL